MTVKAGHTVQPQHWRDAYFSGNVLRSTSCRRSRFLHRSGFAIHCSDTNGDAGLGLLIAVPTAFVGKGPDHV